jgi:calcineurin-like phosphoesterase family protein
MFQDIDVLHTEKYDVPVVLGADPLAPHIFYTADLHLGHANIIRLCNRPFADVQEMNRVLIDNWNARVRDCDQIYIVGDLAFRSAEPVSGLLDQLKGIKHLVVGNHDAKWMKHLDLSNYFASVEKLSEIEDNGRKVVLCHYPLMTWNGRESYLVYGHIHNNKNGSYWPLLKTMQYALNAGVEINDYKPVTLDELIINNDRFCDE